MPNLKLLALVVCLTCVSLGITACSGRAVIQLKEACRQFDCVEANGESCESAECVDPKKLAPKATDHESATSEILAPNSNGNTTCETARTYLKENELLEKYACNGSFLLARQNSLGGLYPNGAMRFIPGKSSGDFGSLPTYYMHDGGYSVPKGITASHPAVGLLIRNNGTGRNRSMCTGTLISDRHVLTAAHCFYIPIDTGAPHANCLVRIALQSQSDSNGNEFCKCQTIRDTQFRDWCENNKNEKTPNGISQILNWSELLQQRVRNNWEFLTHGTRPRKIKNIYIHPEYAGIQWIFANRKIQIQVAAAVPALEHDIAIVELQSSIDLAPPRPADTKQSVETNQTDELSILGYGATGHIGLPFDAGIKRRTLLTEINCKVNDNVVDKHVRNKYLCWAHEYLTKSDENSHHGAACLGDSGGPVLGVDSAKILAVVSAGRLNRCSNRYSYDPTVPTLEYGSRINEKITKWINGIIKKCPRTTEITAARLPVESIEGCTWHIANTFKTNSTFRPLSSTEFVSIDLHQYQLCSDIAKTNSISVNGIWGATYNPWSTLNHQETDINLYAHHDRRFLDKEFRGSKHKKPISEEDFFRNRLVVHGARPGVANYLFHCNESGPGRNATCVIDSTPKDNRRSIPENAYQEYSTNIAVQRNVYEGPYQLIISETPADNEFSN